MFSFLWSSTKSSGAAPASSSPAPPAAPSQSESPPTPPLTRARSTSSSTAATDEEFEFIDAESLTMPAKEESVDTMMSVDAAAAVAAAPPVKEAAPSSTSSVEPLAGLPIVISRACRPYGHAHSPPALIPAISSSSPAIALPAPSPSASSSSTTPAVSAPPSSGKRSFASVAASNAPPAISSRIPIAYAQDASISLSEALRAKIAELEAAQAAARAEPEVDPLEYMDPAPPRQLVRLPRESAIKYTPVMERALEIGEPVSKRAKKRMQAWGLQPLRLTPPDLVAASKARGKPHKVARVEEKAMKRARVEKAQSSPVEPLA